MVSSQLFQCFDQIVLLAHGRSLYSGAGALAPAEYFSARNIPYTTGYNVADYLLDVASDPPVELFQCAADGVEKADNGDGNGHSAETDVEKAASAVVPVLAPGERGNGSGKRSGWRQKLSAERCATTFLTQLEVLSGRELMTLRR